MIITDEMVETACRANVRKLPISGESKWSNNFDPRWPLDFSKIEKSTARDLVRSVLESVAPMILEEAAKVAEHRHKEWRFPHPDDAYPGEVCDDISACRDIARAIRAMAKGGS